MATHTGLNTSSSSPAPTAVLKIYKLWVDGEDTVFYADEKEAWEATKEWDEDEAASVILTEFTLRFSVHKTAAASAMIAALMNAARRDYHPHHDESQDRHWSWTCVKDAVKRAEALEEILENQWMVGTLFSVGQGAGTDVDAAPAQYRWRPQGWWKERPRRSDGL